MLGLETRASVREWTAACGPLETKAAGEGDRQRTYWSGVRGMRISGRGGTSSGAASGIPQIKQMSAASTRCH